MYFGKTFDKYSEINAENASQIAYLIGLGQAPSGYNLYTNPENGIARRNIVLGVLLDKGLISQEVYEGAIKHDIVKTLHQDIRYQNHNVKRTSSIILYGWCFS